MKTANQLTFTTYEASLKLNPNDPTKIIFLKAPSNGSFTNFRHRLGDDIFCESLHQLIAQAVALKVIQGGDTAIDSTHLWAYASRSGKKTCDFLVLKTFPEPDKVISTLTF